MHYLAPASSSSNFSSFFFSTYFQSPPLPPSYLPLSLFFLHPLLLLTHFNLFLFELLIIFFFPTHLHSPSLPPSPLPLLQIYTPAFTINLLLLLHFPAQNTPCFFPYSNSASSYYSISSSSSKFYTLFSSRSSSSTYCSFSSSCSAWHLYSFSPSPSVS